MYRHPTQGIAGSKPRIPQSDPADDSKAKKARISNLSEEYLRTRTEHQHVKLLAAQMELAARRGELISKRLAETQLAYLLTCMRRQLLSLPGALAGQLADLSDVHKIRMVLEGAVHAALGELQDLPSKVVDPHWLEHIDDNGSPSDPEEKPATAKSPRRRPE
jgi:hypothetical protein